MPKPGQKCAPVVKLSPDFLAQYDHRRDKLCRWVYEKDCPPLLAYEIGQFTAFLEMSLRLNTHEKKDSHDPSRN